MIIPLHDGEQQQLQSDRSTWSLEYKGDHTSVPVNDSCYAKCICESQQHNLVVARRQIT